MPVEQIYRYNERRYHLAAGPEGRWVLTTTRLWDTPVHQAFADHQAAQHAYWRTIARTILCSPRRIRTADLDGTALALVPDDDARLHLVEHAGPDGDRVTPYTNRIVALTAWRDRCCTLAHTAANRSPDTSPR